ncbi:cytochrome c [Lentibacillus cibarius]|uniref:Cytochrome c n=1 Tax=Lentibacillus cibarius TaxID=2583219 RepID=A0A549YLK4_9BACI|nr:cytochrome c [Lentibacillus cibarius]TRM12727.1 cytochrome c [Lentibacillus cibarius]
MKKNPVIAYGLIAGIGILLVIIVSVVGLNQQEAIQNEQNGDQKQEEEQDQSGGGETAANGEEVYQNNCASCHGSDLSGGMGPGLSTVGSKYSEEEIREIIANGFPDAGMQPGIVDGKEADAVAQWLSEQK